LRVSSNDPSPPRAVDLLRLPAPTNRQLFTWMFGLTRPVRAFVALSVLWLVLWTAAETLTIRQAGEVINQIQALRPSERAAAGGFWAWIEGGDPATRELLLSLALFTSLVLVYTTFRYMRIVADAKMSMHMVFHIRAAVYDKLQRVGFGFHDALSTGQLINRALSDLQHVRAFIQTAILMSLEITLAVLFSIVLIYTRNPWVALAALAPLPFWVHYVLRFSRKIQPVAKRVQEAEDRNVSLITENIAGAHVVRAFAAERTEIQKYVANCDNFKERVLTRIRMFADFNPVIRGIALASHISLFAVGGVLMIRGEMAAGDLLILGGAMSLVLQRLQGVATINEQYQNAIVSARRLYEVLFATPTVAQKDGAQALPDGPGEVVFEGVTFGYDPMKPILNDLSFRAQGGTVVAIVGPTGAGKSSLVNLIARYYDPQRGRVLIDGVDLRDLALSSLRTAVAFVFQETYLFSDTIAANIAYGRPGLGATAIEAAARLAQAHEFIERLPERYDTVLTERGSSLSGGQRQRLAIARAVVTNPRVLVLDDATAAIDPETEDQIRSSMRSVMKGRSTFIIAHRISTVRRADLVLVLERGRLTQSGTHAELMRADGHYRSIVEAQLRRDDDAGVSSHDRASSGDTR
jgi:ABC-type multidrug transport system fused ATPase/permease subunit